MQGICDDCANKYMLEKWTKTTKHFVLDVICVVISAFILLPILPKSVRDTFQNTAVLALLCLAILYIAIACMGWRFINRITKRDEKEIIGWSLIGVVLKLIASIVLGTVGFPVILIYDVIVLIKNRPQYRS